MAIADELDAGKFEERPSLLKQLYYQVEREVGHRLFRRRPPSVSGPRLLNLGSGAVPYDGWVNADDYAFMRSVRQRGFRPEWRLDVVRRWKCEDDFWDGIFTQHLLEHVSYSAALAVLRECYRTLKPGCWIRVSVPDLNKYVAYYRGEADHEFFRAFQPRALAVSFLTQMHSHRSTWDGVLMCGVLRDIGFVKVVEVPFGQGSDERLVRDQPVKGPESLYVEGQKPERESHASSARR